MSNKLAKRELDEEQLRCLLTRASELQSEKHLAVVQSLTLSDIRQIGREAGIDSACLEQAAEEVGLTTPLDLPPAIREHDQAIVIERSFSGPLDESSAQHALNAARAELASVGETVREPGLVVWRSGDEAGRKLTLTIDDSGREVVLRLVQDIKALQRTASMLVGATGGVLALLLIFLASFLALTPLQNVFLTILLGVGTGLGFGSLFGSRMFRWYVRRVAGPQVEQLQRLADTIVSRIPADTGEAEIAAELPPHDETDDEVNQ